MAIKADRWSKMKEAVKHEGEKKVFEKDVRLWTPTRDEKGNALVILRFLPDNDDNGYIKYTQHSFQYQHGDTSKWYIENCINTLGYERECPLCKKVAEYYNSAHTSDKELANERRAKKIYMSNILILKNPNKPEDENKIFIFKYGQKIFDKIKSRMFPSDTDKADPDFKTFIPFDELEGANFKLKVKGLKRDTNYDDSIFADPSKLYDGDTVKIENTLKNTYPLNEFLAEEKFPTNETVIKKIGHLLGINNSTKKIDTEVVKAENPFVSDDEDDDDLFFAKLKK